MKTIFLNETAYWTIAIYYLFCNLDVKNFTFIMLILLPKIDPVH
jgi:hypothetical protein